MAGGTLMQITRVDLDGRSASLARWSGELDGRGMSVIMYRGVVSTVVVSLHTQDTEGAPPGNREDVLSAFDGIEFSAGD